jgi:hypothetical protein
MIRVRMNRSTSKSEERKDSFIHAILRTALLIAIAYDETDLGHTSITHYKTYLQEVVQVESI